MFKLKRLRWVRHAEQSEKAYIYTYIGRERVILRWIFDKRALK
jgi:hypothetical protein